MAAAQMIRRIITTGGLASALALASSVIVFAQTNTFPSSGNAGIGTTTPADMLYMKTTTNGGVVNVATDGWTNSERGFKILSNTGGGSSVRWKIGSPATTGGEPGGNIGTD